MYNQLDNHHRGECIPCECIPCECIPCGCIPCECIPCGCTGARISDRANVKLYFRRRNITNKLSLFYLINQ